MNMNAIILHLHPLQGSPNNACFVTDAWYNCSTLHMRVWPALVCRKNWMDVNMNTIVLRLHPTRDSPNNAFFVADAWCICSTRSDMRQAFGVSPREGPSGKKHQVLYNFGSAGRTGGSREWLSGRQAAASLKKTEARARSACSTRGSAENNSRVMVTRPDP